MIQFVRELNKPYRRSDFVIEGFCMIIDGIVHIISFGYLNCPFFEITEDCVLFISA